MPNYYKVPLVTITEKHSKITEMEYLIDVLPKLSENGPWIAGGSLLRTKLGLPMSTDIDLFFKNSHQVSEYKDKLQLDYEGKKFSFQKEKISKNSINIFIKYSNRSYTIQLITKKYYDSPCKVLDDFDLNICQLAYDGTSLFVEQNALKSIDDRKIELNYINHGPSVMSRCLKYARYGFTMDNIQINKFFSTVSNEIDLLNVEEYEKF